MCWTIAAVIACGFAAPPDDTPAPPAGLRLFYTGHSFHMFVPARVEQLVKSAGIEGHKLVGTQGIGGSRVIQHWELADDKNKAKPALESGQVDVFTMAAHLAIPDPGIDNFTELGLKHNPKLRLLVQASWMPFDQVSETRRIRDNNEREETKLDELQALAAYCNFAAIYHRTPEGRKRIEPGVDDAQHAILQRIAWETVSSYPYSGIEKR